MIGEWIRRLGFWSLDFLKGSPIRKHYNEVCNTEITEEYMQGRVSEILQYAKAHVPYYKSIDGDSLSDFPVMNKELYNQNYDNMLSDEYKDSDNLAWRSTSGSTGVPFRIPHDKNKRNRNNAELIYIHERCNWKLGERYIYAAAWVAANHKASRLKSFMNNMAVFPVVKLDESRKQEFLHAIEKDKKIKVAIGYSSVITDFAEYCIEKNIVPKCNIKLVVVSSDALQPGAKEKIEQVFGCPLVNRYGNEEHGILGYKLSNEKSWQINTASFYIEILKQDEDAPAAPGEVGRVVVTDLTNHAFPSIRYDIGDLARSDSYNGKFVTEISELAGRVKDVICSTAGEKLSGVVVCSNIRSLKGIKKYQIIQEDTDSYKVKIVEKEYEKINQDEISDALKRCLGDDAKIEIELVDLIEASRGGKYRPVICNLIKKG